MFSYTAAAVVKKSEREDENVSVEQLDVVDIVSTDRETGHVILTISDHLDWSDSIQHQTMLQAKFNKYLSFIESGEIVERYPDGKKRLVAIKVVFKYRPDAQGWRFLKRAKQVIESAGLYLETRDLCRIIRQLMLRKTAAFLIWIKLIFRDSPTILPVFFC